jgi:membrane protein required for colicin V production
LQKNRGGSARMRETSTPERDIGATVGCTGVAGRRKEKNRAMNSFDAAVYLVAVVAVVSGFNSGLLRSTATIIGYLAAMPVAVAATPLVSRMLADKFNAPGVQNSIVLCAVFLLAGIGFGALLRTAISETIGPKISLSDRLAGSLLGAVRIGLVAVTMVLVFDRIIPANRQPAFLSGSQLRPILSMAGQKGLKSLPPDVTAFIDRLKKDQRI